jgi:hypothetical protein
MSTNDHHFSASNVSLMRIFGICPILHNYYVLKNYMLIHIYALDNIFVVC